MSVLRTGAYRPTSNTGAKYSRDFRLLTSALSLKDLQSVLFSCIYFETHHRCYHSFHSAPVILPSLLLFLSLYQWILDLVHPHQVWFLSLGWNKSLKKKMNAWIQIEADPGSWTFRHARFLSCSVSFISSPPGSLFRASVFGEPVRALEHSGRSDDSSHPREART